MTMTMTSTVNMTAAATTTTASTPKATDAVVDDDDDDDVVSFVPAQTVRKGNAVFSLETE